MQFGVREKGDVTILDLAGEIRLAAEASLSVQALVKEQLVAGKKKILLNFEKVDFLDSYGVGDVLAAFVSTQEKGGKLKVFHLSSKIWLIFNYSGLTRILETFDTEDQALRSFA
jgi:anti-sigma B factor antagonist